MLAGSGSGMAGLPFPESGQRPGVPNILPSLKPNSWHQPRCISGLEVPPDALLP